jgi:hypothetical protein
MIHCVLFGAAKIKIKNKFLLKIITLLRTQTKMEFDLLVYWSTNSKNNTKDEKINSIFLVLIF